jgi:hypothetical protein
LDAIPEDPTWISFAPSLASNGLPPLKTRLQVEERPANKDARPGSLDHLPLRTPLVMKATPTVINVDLGTAVTRTYQQDASARSDTYSTGSKKSRTLSKTTHGLHFIDTTTSFASYNAYVPRLK